MASIAERRALRRLLMCVRRHARPPSNANKQTRTTRNKHGSESHGPRWVNSQQREQRAKKGPFINWGATAERKVEVMSVCYLKRANNCSNSKKIESTISCDQNLHQTWA